MGGGGGSKSKSVTYSTTTIAPVTNLNFDEEVIADAILESTDKQIEAEKALASIQKAALDLKAAELAIEEDNKNKNLLLDMKKHEQMVLLGVLIGGAYLYKNLKKGK